MTPVPTTDCGHAFAFAPTRSRAWLHKGYVHGLLHKSVDAFAPRAGGAPVEAKCKLIQVGVQMLSRHRALVNARQPPVSTGQPLDARGAAGGGLPAAAHDAGAVRGLPMGICWASGLVGSLKKARPNRRAERTIRTRKLAARVRRVSLRRRCNSQPQLRRIISRSPWCILVQYRSITSMNAHRD